MRTGFAGVFLFCIALTTLAEPKARLQDEISNVAAKAKSASLLVYKGDNEFFSYNKEELLPAGALVNYIVSAAAVEELGLGYQFPTEIYVDNLPAEIDNTPERVDFKDPVLSIGNLYIRGYGDPTLDSKRLLDFAEIIMQSGILDFNDIILDSSLVLDRNPVSKALPFNENKLNIYLAPNKNNSPAFCNLDFGVPIKIEGEVKTTYVNALNPEDAIISSLAADTLKIKGVIGMTNPGLILKKELTESMMTFGEVLKARLQQAGVKVRGKVRSGKVPKSAKSVAILYSDNLEVLIKKLNRTNSDFLLNQILIGMGQEKSGGFSLQKGREKVFNFVSASKVDPTSLDLFNSKMVTGESLMKILLTSQKSRSNKEVLLTSMSKFGEVGSLKSSKLLEIEQLNKAFDRSKMEFIQNNSWFIPFIDGMSFGVLGIINTEEEPINFVLIVNERDKELNPLMTISQLILLAGGLDIAAPQLIP